MEIRICKKHGTAKHCQESTGYWRCYKCVYESVARRRDKIKLKLVEFHGGKCIICGYNKSINALEFHHRVPAEKKFSLSKNNLCYSWEKILEESKKCDLLCANCHREVHDKQAFVAQPEEQFVDNG